MLVNIGLNHFVPYQKNHPIEFSQLQGALRGKSFIKYYSVNVTKFAVFCRFGHIYWRNSYGKVCFLCSDSKLFSETFLETTKMVIVAGIGATWQPDKKIRNIFYSHTKTNL